jgi:tRNA-dihydrouridine synthase A
VSTVDTEALISIAPMMDWTDRHCRYFLRQFSPRSLLYTEMVTAAALVHGDCERLLRFDEAEHPLALQLGGSDPGQMAEAAARGCEAGYDEININVGCPSDRVQSGQFGACLMAAPEKVAACVRAMRDATGRPVTVKTRIGIDDNDSDAYLDNFVAQVADAGCETFIVHARIAILEGLSPKENRTVPPLNYPRVYRLKAARPGLRIVLNGGINECAEAQEHLQHVDGVMIGRQAYHAPWFIAELDQALHATDELPERVAIVHAMRGYIERAIAEGAELKHVTRHMLGLFAGQPGARAWRRYLSENAYRPGCGFEVLERALQVLPRAA